MSTNVNFSDSTPSAPSGQQNVKWQGNTSNPRNISANVPSTGGAVVKTTNYTATLADCGRLLVFNSGSAVTLTLPATAPALPTGATPSQWQIDVENIGAGALTISPNGLTLDGSSSSLTLNQNQGLTLETDGTNYFTQRGVGGSGSSGTWAEQVPSGTLNGTNLTFTLSYMPLSNTLNLYRNGVRQDKTRWYSISGTTITFVIAPKSTDYLWADYSH